MKRDDLIRKTEDVANVKFALLQLRASIVMLEELKDNFHIKGYTTRDIEASIDLTHSIIVKMESFHSKLISEIVGPIDP